MKLTVKNRYQWTLQEACDYSVKQIVAQGKQCVDRDDYCVYSNGKGNHCAIGWLLQDVAEAFTFTGSIDQLEMAYPEALPEVVKENLSTFCILQKFHDKKSYWEREFALKDLQEKGVNTEGLHWHQWLEKGLPQEKSL